MCWMRGKEEAGKDFWRGHVRWTLKEFARTKGLGKLEQHEGLKTKPSVKMGLEELESHDRKYY